MNSATLAVLLEFQVPKIKRLKLINYQHDATVAFPGLELPGLESLRINSMDDLEVHFRIGELLKDNSNSLRELSFGAEATAVKFNHNPDDDVSSEIDFRTHFLVDQIKAGYKGGKLPETPLLRLDSCELKFLDVSALMKPGFCLVNIAFLTSLCLESCWGLANFLPTLICGRDQQSRMSLRSFSLRHERGNNSIRPVLLSFLGALPPLIHLSVLLEMPSPFLDLTTVLQVHGTSLRSLVWDQQTRHGGGRVPLIPPPSQVMEIILHCPYLVELGVTLDWGLFMETADRRSSMPEPPSSFLNAQKALRGMKALRTLNVRNIPSTGSFDVAVRGDCLHAAFANSVLATLFDTADGFFRSPSPPLETLALGSLTYRDVYNGVGCLAIKDEATYNFIRLKVYSVDRAYYFEGQRKPLAILREKGSYEKTEADGGRVTVLKPYWLSCEKTDV
ncbi:MAG: hypothetical protein Q9213_000741 [Squamulea squamosa]